MITCVRIHDLRKDPELARGTTVLVDRLWPRGVKKDAVHLDHWLKNVAPSPELRKWFNHDEEKFEEFSTRYRKELNASEEEDVDKLQKLVSDGDVTLVFAAKDRDINHAVVLKKWLEEWLEE